jgi:tetratricopeptide (TPR) repeat protein
MAHTALAIFDLFSGRHEEARQRLRRALDLDPNSMFARGYLGISRAFGGDYESAFTNVEEALRLSPRGPLLIIWHLCKGWAALLAGRDEETVEYATQAAEANSEFPDSYAVLASANGHLGKAGPACAALDQLLQRLPALTTSDARLDRPFARAVNRERFLERLRKAGMRKPKRVAICGRQTWLIPRSQGHMLAFRSSHHNGDPPLKITSFLSKTAWQASVGVSIGDRRHNLVRITSSGDPHDPDPLN